MARLNPNSEGDTTPGRCANLDYCSIGMQRILVEIPVDKPFICPECSGKLRPPAATGLDRPWVMPALRVAILLAGVGIGTVQGYYLGRRQIAAPKPVATVSRDTLTQVNAARARLGLTNLPADSVKVAPEAAPAAVPAPAAAKPPAEPFLVVNRPYPRRSPPLETVDPPQRLAGEQRFGQVVIDCRLGAIQVRPDCHASNIKGGDAFSAAAVGWLNGLFVQYAPGDRHGTPALLEHRWRVVFEDFSGDAPQAKPQPAPRR